MAQRLNIKRTDIQPSESISKGTPVLRSAKRALANVRRLNNSSDVIFYCSVSERSRALALLNAALINVNDSLIKIYKVLLVCINEPWFYYRNKHL